MGLNRLFSKKTLTPMCGVDICDTAIYLLGLQHGSGRYRVSTAMRLPLAAGIVVGLQIQQPAALIEALKQLAHQREGVAIGAVAVSIPAAAAITKIIPFAENLADREIEQHLIGQLPHYLNISAETVYFDYERFTQPENSTPSALRLVAVRREEVDQRVSLFQAAGWSVTAVDIEPLTLERAAQWLISPQEQQQMLGILHVTGGIATFYVLYHGQLIFNRMELYHSNLSTALQHLWQWFSLTKPAAQLDKLLLSGEASLLTQLQQQITSNIPSQQFSQHFVAPQIINPFLNCAIDADVDSEQLATFATEYLVSYGLAMRNWEK
jgi:Tfp pilus assembly PilM family ATPase